MVNRVILIGNLGADPEIRTLENGAMVAKLRLATNENYRDKSGEWQTQTEWHDIIAWRALAERAQSSLKKGDAIYVEGKLTHRTWQDQDGNNRYTTEVVANYVRLIQKREGGGGYTSSPGYFPAPDDEVANAGAPVNQDKGNNDHSSSGAEAADDDLPF